MNSLTGEVKDLTEKLSQEAEQKKEVGEKYIGALKARTTSEQDFKSKLQMSKLLTDKQMAELDEKQSQIGNLKVEVRQSG